MCTPTHTKKELTAFEGLVSPSLPLHDYTLLYVLYTSQLMWNVIQGSNPVICVIQGCTRQQEMDQDISSTDSNSCYDNLLSEEAPPRASVCVCR